jgi:hypothetical protein
MGKIVRKSKKNRSYKKRGAGWAPDKTPSSEMDIIETSDEEDVPSLQELTNRLNRLRMDEPSTPPRRDEIPVVFDSDEEMEEIVAPGAPRRNRRRVMPIPDEEVQETESRRVLFPDFDDEMMENEEMINDVPEDNEPPLPQQGGRKRKTLKKRRRTKKKRSVKRRKTTRRRKNTRKH